jgi:hypothetical protein
VILESSHQAVCDALHRAIIERDQLKADLAEARSLYDIGMQHRCDLQEELAAARAEADLLRGVVRDARSYLRSGESVSALSVLRNALDAAPATDRGHVDGGRDTGNRSGG